MSSPRPRSRGLVRSVCIATVAIVLTGYYGCAPPGDEVLFPSGLLPGEVILRIENQSGFTVSVEAVFLQGDVLVRRTERLLSPSGVEAVDEIIPTNAESIIVTARLADQDASGLGIPPGEILQFQIFERGMDFNDESLLVFVVSAPPPAPEPPPDCAGDCPVPGDLNGDHVADVLDIPIFIDLVLERSSDPVAFRRADLNFDGLVDGRDLINFVACLQAPR